MCQTVMPRGNDPMAQGLFWAMLILLIAPFLVVGVIGVWLYYNPRTTRDTSTDALRLSLSERDHLQDQQ